ncbi:GTPase HflX [bacterium]|nr:GTPase HflX [bacterium]
MSKRKDRSSENAGNRQEARAARRTMRGETKDPRKIRGEEVAIVVGLRLPDLSREDAEESLAELASLARASGARVAGSMLQSRARVDGRTFLGSGKAAELKDEAERLGANLILVDHDLSPAQARNLEKIADVKILDRTELILDIFARRADTPQAKLQVEVAQLEYLLPRLTRLWDHLSRTGGGIGTRGPGETQLEVDRRRVRARLSQLKAKLKRFGARQEVSRSQRAGGYRVALVGYTNTGKSSLMNRLTKAEVEERNRLFETLDATTRSLDLGAGYHATLTDTVGFVRRLPHGLVESFRATLSEVAQADLLLHVCDAADPNSEPHRKAVQEVLSEIGAGDLPEIRVFNKADLLPEDARNGIARRVETEGGLLVSALEEVGLDSLRDEIRARISRDWIEVGGVVPPEEGEILARLRASTTILDERETEHGPYLRIRVSASRWRALQGHFGIRAPEFFYLEGRGEDDSARSGTAG